MSKRFMFCALCLVVMISIGYGCTILQPRMSYQGQLTDNLGNPVPNGTYPMTFRLYSEESAPILDAQWKETQPVVVNDGIFSISLGSTEYITTSLFSQTLWLGVEVGTDGEMTPRQQLTGAPYAMSLVPGSIIYGSVPNTLEYPSTLNVSNIGSGYGIGVNAIGDAGVAISGEYEGTATAQYGLMIEQVLAGAVITATDGIGVDVQTTGDYGTRSVSTDEDGVFGWGMGPHGFDTGITGRSDDGFGVYGFTMTDSYGLYTNDDLYVGGSIVTTGVVSFISRNGSDEIMLPGTAVSAMDVHILEDANLPVMNVVPASVGNTVLGVVVGGVEKIMIEPGRDDIKPGLHFGKVSGNATPGEYLVIVVQGLAQVRSTNSALKAGDMAYVGTDGDGASAVSTGDAIGMAVSPVDNDGMLWVLVGFD